MFSPAALHNDAALSRAVGEGKSIHNSKKQRGAGAAAVSQNNKLRRRKLNLYLLMEADCIIHSAGASECVGNRMYDGWPRWRSSPLCWAVHLFICLFIYSLIQRDASKLWNCFKAAAAAVAVEECLAALENAPSSSLSSGWLGLNRHLGQDVTLQRCLLPHVPRLRKSEPPSVLFLFVFF